MHYISFLNAVHCVSICDRNNRDTLRGHVYIGWVNFGLKIQAAGR